MGNPISTTLLKSYIYIDSLIVPITNIFNKSLKEGVFPYKNTHLIPLLKKPSLDKDKLHPACLHLSNQSAYKKNHSTETTLLKITNDISTNMKKEEGYCTDFVGSVGCV